MGTDLAGCQADFRVAEDIALWAVLVDEWMVGFFFWERTYGEEIHHAHHDHYDACTKD